MTLGTTKPHIYYRHGCYWASYRGTSTSGVTIRSWNLRNMGPKKLNLQYNERRHG
jgi:hypothetical protein